MVLETGIFVSQAIWLWRVRHIRREAKAAGQTYDEYVAANPSKRLRSESAETVVDVEACHASKAGSVCADGQDNEKATHVAAGDDEKEKESRVDSVSQGSPEGKEKEVKPQTESVVVGGEAKEKTSGDEPQEAS
jgi:hypothetical protein